MVSVGLPWSTTFHEFYIYKYIYTLYLYIIYNLYNRIFYFCSIFSRKMDRTGYLTSLPELRKVNWIPSKPVVAPLWASKVSLVVGSKVSVKQKRTWAAAGGKSGNGAEKPAIYGHSMGNMSINQLIWDMRHIFWHILAHLIVCSWVNMIIPPKRMI